MFSSMRVDPRLRSRPAVFLGRLQHEGGTGCVRVAPVSPSSSRRPPRSAVYRRRQPARTLLYRTVQTHLATWLALHNDGAGASAPAATERELGRYLDCGILAHGFALAPAALRAGTTS